MYITIDSNLNTTAFVYGENISLSLYSINEIRQIESLLSEIVLLFTNNGI